MKLLFKRRKHQNNIFASGQRSQFICLNFIVFVFKSQGGIMKEQKVYQM